MHDRTTLAVKYAVMQMKKKWVSFVVGIKLFVSCTELLFHVGYAVANTFAISRIFITFTS
jgi:hypothetical protein